MGGDGTYLRWPSGERLPRNSYFIMLFVVLLFCAIEGDGKTGTETWNECRESDLELWSSSNKMIN